MQFYDLATIKPEDGQRCIVKEKLPSGGISVFPWPQSYYTDTGFLCHPRAVQWAPIPAHVNEDRGPWMSEYWEDELPEKSCECLVCADSSRFVRYAYFDAKKQKFLGYDDVFAFLII